ncbi:hypothetical protein SEA_RAVENCO17_32 [Gordonia phage RavenCo17]|nr:hypothetical protein SEA_RAVENCO17_32 [Gordonia phage RavenCo17]
MEESNRVPDDDFVEFYKRHLRTLADHTADATTGTCVADGEPMPCIALREVLRIYL